MAKNTTALKRGFHYDPINKDLGIYLNGVQMESYSEVPGRTYYVNNITGASTNDGLSWGSAFDEVTTAITAQIAYSLAKTGVAPTAAGIYGRDRILVMGTGTTYANIATLPQMCDVIGVGATTYGDGTGIARIGLAGYDGIAGTARGLGLYNLQFQAPTGQYCADFVSLFRSEIAYCTFQSRITDAAAGIRFSGASSGNWIHNCLWTAGGGAAWSTIGIDIRGASFNNNVIENNHIVATQCGIYVVSTCVDAGGTIVRNNTFGGEGLAWGVDDNATNGTIMYSGNYLFVPAGQGGALVDAGTARWVCNYSAATFSAVTGS